MDIASDTLHPYPQRDSNVVSDGTGSGCNVSNCRTLKSSGGKFFALNAAFKRLLDRTARNPLEKERLKDREDDELIQVKKPRQHPQVGRKKTKNRKTEGK